MIYEFTMTETKKSTVPVRAYDYQEAEDIFCRWYKKHTEDPTDTTVYDMLDDGAEGIVISSNTGRPEEDYAPGDILLPEESPDPAEPLYNLLIFTVSVYVRTFAFYNLTLQQIGAKMDYYGAKYFLYPADPNELIHKDLAQVPNRYAKNPTFWIRAVPKD